MKQEVNLKFLTIYNEILFIWVTLKINLNDLCKTIRAVINTSNESQPNMYLLR